ncbi:MAG: hypothetical protein ACQESF_01015 [Nanobdellota archaeon]
MDKKEVITKVQTDIDSFYSVITQKGMITLKQAVSELELDSSSIEKFVEVLEKSDKVISKYPLFGKPVFYSKQYFEKLQKEKKGFFRKKKKTETAQDSQTQNVSVKQNTSDAHKNSEKAQQITKTKKKTSKKNIKKADKVYSNKPASKAEKPTRQKTNKSESSPALKPKTKKTVSGKKKSVKKSVNKKKKDGRKK